MARCNSYTYNPSTGEWSMTESSAPSKAQTQTQPKPTDNLTSSNSDKDSSRGSAEKKNNTIEYNTLSGTLNFIATKETIKLKAGDTVTIKGIGSYLSGKYYVQDVTRSISASGYSHSATLLKTDVGKSLKFTNSTEKPKDKAVEPSAPKKEQTYTVKKGDCLWKIAKQYYGNGAKYGKIASANGISAPYTIYPGQTLTIP